MSERVQQPLVVWELVAAGACFAVAVIALVLGFVFTTHWLLDDQYHPLLHTLGLVLLIIGIPIMLLGAHFLDLQEKKLDDSRRNSTSAHIVGLVSVFLFIPLASVHAQQTIFNVPSTDVLGKGKVYAELTLVPAIKWKAFPGGQFGFEQPLNRKITFAADWFTGKHAAGYFTPGIIFKAGPRVTGYAGYSIGNQNVSGGNHFFLLELGYNVN